MTIEQDNRLKGGGVPDAGGRVPAGRDQPAAIGMPGQGRDPVGVTGEAALEGAVAHVPDADEAILAGRGQALTVAIESQGADRPGRLLRGPKFLQQGRSMPLPEPDTAVIVSGGQQLRIGAEGHGRRPGWGVPVRQLLAGRSHPDRKLIASRRHQPAAGVEAPLGGDFVQRMPFDLLLGIKVPVAEHPRLLDGPQRAVRRKTKGEQVAVGVEWPQAECAHNDVGGTAKERGRNGRAHGTISHLENGFQQPRNKDGPQRGGSGWARTVCAG